MASIPDAEMLVELVWTPSTLNTEQKVDLSTHWGHNIEPAEPVLETICFKMRCIADKITPLMSEFFDTADRQELKENESQF